MPTMTNPTSNLKSHLETPELFEARQALLREGIRSGDLERQVYRLRAALQRYGRHAHPNCHDLTLIPGGQLGPRNGCLCGLDTALSGNPHE